MKITTGVFTALLLSGICISTAVDAQKKPVVPEGHVAPMADTMMRKRPMGPQALKPFQEVIPGSAVTSKGLITVHRVEDKWYFEIPDSILNTDLLIVNRIAKGGADCRSSMPMMGYAGDEINRDVINFEKGPNNKLFVRSISFEVYARDTSGPMYQAVRNSNTQPIILAFDIKALGKKSVVIEVTDMIKGDEPTFSFNPTSKKVLKLGGLQADKSYIETIKSFPLNTEIKTIKTYSKMAGGGAGPMGSGPEADMGASTATLEINSSIVLLPRQPMTPRYFDERVGFFNTSYTDYDANPQRVKHTSMAIRWRLEPKAADLEKFKRGELVEPEKPIVYYIDPATPAKLVPYIKKAVTDWQVAFEQAGFKNAILAKDAPTLQQDSTWSIEDARNSVIIYKASDVANASGPNVNDPRSGEIIESHINFYHNVMSLVHDWYLIQASPSDERARKLVFDDTLMGELVYTVVAHEVGHTLGLRHNWGASFATPVEKLRDKAWLEVHGHTSSIMDYARFNYVAQPEDKVGIKGIFPRINDYDKWAIEWGYKPVLNSTPEEEKAILNKWVVERTKNPRLRFISGEGKESDPRAVSEDLSDNVMKANAYGIKNLQFVVKNLPAWATQPGENYDALEELYKGVFSQYRRYLLGHVFNFIGGVYTDSKTSDQPGPVYTAVPKSTQREAVDFIATYCFNKPTWLLNKQIMDKVVKPNFNILLMTADGMLVQMMTIAKFNDIINLSDGVPGAYTLPEYLSDIQNALWTELKSNEAIDSYRRLLQKSYVNRMAELVNTPLRQGQSSVMQNGGMDASKSDVGMLARMMLGKLKASITAAIPLQKDAMSKAHLQDVQLRITNLLNNKVINAAN